MKCEVTTSTTHNVWISKEIIYKSYKEICSGEPKKVKIGFNNDPNFMYVEDNTILEIPKQNYIKGDDPQFSKDWEVFSKFISTHNIEPNWLNCNMTWGWYDEDLGGWTGCIGKV